MFCDINIDNIVSLQDAALRAANIKKKCYVPEQWIPLHSLRQCDQFCSGVWHVTRHDEEVVELGSDGSTFAVKILNNGFNIWEIHWGSEIPTPEIRNHPKTEQTTIR